MIWAMSAPNPASGELARYWLPRWLVSCLRRTHSDLSLLTTDRLHQGHPTASSANSRWLPWMTLRTTTVDTSSQLLIRGAHGGRGLSDQGVLARCKTMCENRHRTTEIEPRKGFSMSNRSFARNLDSRPVTFCTPSKSYCPGSLCHSFQALPANMTLIGICFRPAHPQL